MQKMSSKSFLLLKTIPILLILGSFTSLNSDINTIDDNCSSMIYNDRMMKKSWIYLNQDEGKYYKYNTDISEGDNLNMPYNSWDATFTDNATQQKFYTPKKTNASVKFVTLGYKLVDQKKTVGFDFTIINNKKKTTEPNIFRITNNSQKEGIETLGNIREVGFVFDNWPQYWPVENKWLGGYHSFKQNYNINDLEKIVVKFKLRLADFKDSLSKNRNKGKWLGSYVTCDFRFNEYDEKGNIVNKYLIGVIVSNPLDVDYNENRNDEILFGDGNPNRDLDRQQILLLHGNKIGVKQVNKILPAGRFEDIEIDFKPLITKYLSLNKNKRNLVTGLDIYSGTRGADLAFDIKDIQLLGCKR